MSNLRRHFNFGLNKYPSCQGKSLDSDLEGIGDSSKNTHFSKSKFIGDVGSCLDLCSSYIQALNALCGAGTTLAKSLFRVVHDVPLYHDIACQFLNIWEDVSKATAGASAAVKTETLMLLQEVLNQLEEDVTNENVVLAESIQTVGSCLLSYIELQAQFSLLAWKSLSKLLKNFSSEGLLGSLSPMTTDTSLKHKLLRNSNLSSTIKKHFTHLLHKIGGSKSTVTTDLPYSQFYLEQSTVNESPSQGIVGYQEYLPSGGNATDTLSSTWCTGTATWNNDNHSLPLAGQGITCTVASSKGSSSMTDSISELQDVINLLSCTPGDQIPLVDSSVIAVEYPFIDEKTDRHQPWNTSDLLSDTIHQRYSSYNGKKTWPGMGRGVAFGFDSWIWGSDHLDSTSSLSVEQQDQLMNSDSSIAKNTEDTGVGDTHRRHSTSEGRLDIQTPAVTSIDKAAFPSWDNKALSERTIKTSTWPLKQTGRRLVEPPHASLTSGEFSVTGNWGQKDEEEERTEEYQLFVQLS